MVALENINKKRAALIYERRKTALGLTRQEAATKCKVSAQTFVRAEDPEYNIDVATLRAIAEGLEIPLADLLPLDEKAAQSENLLRDRLRLFSLIPYLNDAQVSKFLGMFEVELGLERSDSLPTLPKHSKSAG